MPPKKTPLANQSAKSRQDGNPGEMEPLKTDRILKTDKTMIMSPKTSETKQETKEATKPKTTKTTKPRTSKTNPKTSKTTNPKTSKPTTSKTTTSAPKTSKTSKASKTSSDTTKKKKQQASLDFYSDIDHDLGTLKPNSQSLSFGRQNSLMSMLSSNANSKETSNSHAKKTSVNGLKSRESLTGDRSFEEDEGFKYKRSQESTKPSTTKPSTAKQNTKPKPKSKAAAKKDEPTSKSKTTAKTASRKKQVSTPIARLQQETANLLSDEDESVPFDTEPPKPKPKTKTPTSRRTTTAKSTNGRAKQGELQLTSPIKSPRPSPRYQDEFSSDGYSEEVSHHQIDLAPESPSSPPPIPSPASKKRPHPRAHEPRRTTKRRASYHNRSTRISSIGNGFEGEPHDNIPPRELYKFLNDGMPDPNRMRQLLVWCFKRASLQHLGGGESNATKSQAASSLETVKGITKVIADEFLEGLTNGKVSTSWYSRQEDEDKYGNELRPVLPNPLNETNKENIKVFQKKLAELRRDKSAWEKAYKTSVQPLSDLEVESTQGSADDLGELKEYLESKQNDREDDSSEMGPTDFNSTVLDESYLQSIHETWQDVKQSVPEKLETTVDKLYHTSFQVQKANELVQTLQQNSVSNKVSSLVKKYISKNDMVGFSNGTASTNANSTASPDAGGATNENASGSPHWPLPKRAITTHELLRGITRVDKPTQLRGGNNPTITPASEN